MDKPPATMSRNEAIAYTNLPRRAFDRLLEAGALTNFGTPFRWRFSRAQLDRLLEGGLQAEGAAQQAAA